MTVLMAIIKLLCTAPLPQFIITSPNINQTDFYFIAGSQLGFQVYNWFNYSLENPNCAVLIYVDNLFDCLCC